MLELSPHKPFKCVLNDTAKVPFIHFVFNSKTLKCLFSAIYICMFYTICFIALTSSSIISEKKLNIKGQVKK